MPLPSLPSHPSLAGSSRLGAVAARLAASPLAETALLVSFGIGAAFLTLYVDLDLRVPGHSILRVVVPLALGLALVPRRGAGTVMGGAALVTVLAHGVDGAPGWGAAASLVLTGPILDFAARRARTGREVYLSLVAAGFAANAVAFAIRLGAKIALHDGGTPLGLWWPRASVTYSLCGVGAGLVAAMLWFRRRGSYPRPAPRPGGTR